MCSVSIDLDPIDCYYRIHGLGETPAGLRHVIMHRCVPRFAEVLKRREIRATFFVVGKDISTALGGDGARIARQTLTALAGQGHELGNHTYQHYYGLSRMPRTTIAEEIDRAHGLISDVAGRSVVGFRAPGYGISAGILQHLLSLDYRYDSSVLPSPPYYLAKAVVLAAMALVGVRSDSILTDPRGMLAPRAPYPIDPEAPWRRGTAAAVQLPISVTPWTRIPVIGTSLLTAPAWLRSYWLRVMRRQSFFNFELHGIDLVDVQQDHIPRDLVARQPGLRTPLARRRRILEAILEELGTDHEFLPLRDVAGVVQMGHAADDEGTIGRRTRAADRLAHD